ncbi:hypothetical protein ACHAPU_011326 [Fusarium lateritium]
MPDKVQMPGSVFVAQAMDDRVAKLRDPLPSNTLLSTTTDDVQSRENSYTDSHDDSKEKAYLAIIGGESTSRASLASVIIRLLTPLFAEIIHVPDIGNKDLLSKLPQNVNLHILSLVECDLDGAIGTGLFRSLFYELPETRSDREAHAAVETGNGDPISNFDA